MERCWILVGMMGAGKSAVGRSLAVSTGRGFLDTDLMVQHRLGRSIAQLFNIYGEPAFRDHETSVLRSLQPSYDVLSTGGGVVLREENWTEMRRLGTTIYLDTAPEILIARLEASKKKRPLLQVENWKEKLKELLQTRQPLYRRADISVRIDSDSVDGAGEQVLEALRYHQP